MSLLELPAPAESSLRSPEATAPASHDELPPCFPVATRRIWGLLVSAATVFGIILSIYAIVYTTWAQSLTWGRQFLDQGWGVLGSLVLLVSCATMAMAARCARLGERFNVLLLVTLTIMCGICFAGVRTIEYSQSTHELKVLAGGQPPAQPDIPSQSAALVVPQPAQAPSAAIGQKFYAQVCAACHGPGGEGVTGLGLPLRDSGLVKTSTPQALATFIKTGRQANDPQSKMKAMMPPRGGAAFLTDAHIDSIAAHLQKLAGAAPAPAGGGATPPASASAAAATAPAANEDAPRWFAPDPVQPPAGLKTAFLRENHAKHLPPDPSDDAGNFESAKMFFGSYFTMTGLHALHALAGMGILVWLFVLAAQGRLNPRSHAAVQLSALYWHTTAVIGICLYPLLYLVS